jgi:hypothetical protein
MPLFRVFRGLFLFRGFAWLRDERRREQWTDLVVADEGIARPVPAVGRETTLVCGRYCSMNQADRRQLGEG